MPLRHKNVRRGNAAIHHPAVEIEIDSGTGFVGSVYKVSPHIAGNWYAGASPISGETGETYTMTPAVEGLELTYRAGGLISNIIQMFTPRATSPTVWLDAYDTSTLTLDGSLVTQWRSKTNGYTFDQATAGSKPSWSATGRNSKPAVLTDVTMKFLEINTLTGMPSGNGNSQTLALAYDANNSAAAWRILHYWNNRFLGKSSPNAAVSLTGGSVALDHKSSQIWSLTDRIVSAAFAGTSATLHVDGGSAETKSGTYNMGATVGYLFRSGNTSQFWIGSAQEIIIHGTLLSDGDRQSLEGYLAHRWGLTSLLPGGHPYKTDAPRIQ